MTRKYVTTSLLVGFCLAQTPLSTSTFGTLSGFKNGTTASAPTTSASGNATATGGCPVSCSIVQQNAPAVSLTWKPVNITATVTQATVIALVDQFNHTSYSTKYNTNFSEPIPTNTNSAGTVTFAVTAYDIKLSKNVTKTVDYPNRIRDYVDYLEWQGILPTVYPNGTSSCLVRTAEPTSDPYLSHPFLPIETGTADPKDPRGWTYFGQFNDDNDFPLISSLFPDFAPIQSCSLPTGVVAPQFAVNGASFTTITSTSRVIGPVNPAPSPPNGPPAPPGPTGGNPPSNPNPPAQPPASPPAQPIPPAQPTSNQPVPAPNPGQPQNPAPNPGAPAPNQPQGPGSVPGIPAQNPSSGQPQGPGPAPTQPGQGSNPPQGQPGGPSSGGQGPANPAPQGNSPGGAAPQQQPGGPVAGPNGPAPGGSIPGAPAAPGQVEGPLPAPLVVGGSSIAPTQQGVLIGNGVTLSQGAPATNIGGTQVSVGNGNIVVGGSTQAIPSAGAAAPITVGGQAFTAGQGAPFFVVSGQTIQPGGPAATVSGQAISLGPAGNFAVVGGATQNLAASGPTSRPQLTFGSTIATANAQGNFVVAGQTITPGAPAVTISGTPVSVAPGGTVAAIGGSTQQLAAPTTRPAQLTLGSSTITANAQGNFVVNGQTITPGSPAVTVSGSTISIPPGGTAAVVNGVTQQLSSPTNAPRVITVNGQTYTAEANGAITIAGQILTPGSVIIVSGTAISLGASTSYAVIGGSTQVLATATAAGASAAITAGSATLTRDSNGNFVFGSTTLTPGGSAVVSGTTISLAPGGSVAVINGQTSTLGPTGTGGLGGVSATATGGRAMYTGGVDRIGVGGVCVLGVAGLVAGVVV